MDTRPYSREHAAIVDFESRSGCSLKNHGTWRYSVDPSTEALCMAYRLPHWERGRTGLWYPDCSRFDIEDCDYDDLMELFEWVDQGEPLEAHNAFFEQCVWQNIMLPTYGFPAVKPVQWMCSAAKCAALALPRALDDAINALGITTKKDTEGSKVMKKMTKPRKPRKAERLVWEAKYGEKVPHRRLYHEDGLLMRRLFAYCRRDVLAEQALSDSIHTLSPHEQEIFHLDQTVNTRGFQLDVDAVNAALALIRREQARFNKELITLTQGKVTKATQRGKMTDWFAEQGLLLIDTQKGTLDEELQRTDLPPHVMRALYLVRALGRSSTAKYQAMRDWADKDGRVRGGLLYHGASTGRWSGKGVQPHNFPRPSVKAVKADWDGAWKAIKTRRRAEVIKFGDPMAVMADAIRGASTAGTGNTLYVADYAAIEARVLLWLVNDRKALGIFERGEDIYCDMASAIYNKPCNKKDHPEERQLGKIAILGLGYQMGASKFVDACATNGVVIEEDFAVEVVRAYREKYSLVKQEWYGQEAAACEAVSSGKPARCGRVMWFTRGRFLFCQLPSGRRLAYCDPKVKPVMTPWGQEKPQLSFMAVNPLSRRWQRQHTYGGSIVENIVQAISRDLMADAMLRCEAHPTYSPVLSVHDEIIAEAPEGQGDVKEFEALMAACPQPWAKGCPVAAEGWSGFRYRK